jgi:hypothetical protein
MMILHSWGSELSDILAQVNEIPHSPFETVQRFTISDACFPTPTFLSHYDIWNKIICKYFGVGLNLYHWSYFRMARKGEMSPEILNNCIGRNLKLFTFLKTLANYRWRSSEITLYAILHSKSVLKSLIPIIRHWFKPYH